MQDPLCGRRPEAREDSEDQPRSVECISSIVENMGQAQEARDDGAIEYHLHVGVDEIDSLSSREARDREHAPDQAREEERDVRSSELALQGRERRKVNLGPQLLVPRHMRPGPRKDNVRLDAHRNELLQQREQALIRAAHLLGEGIEIKDPHIRNSIAWPTNRA